MGSHQPFKERLTHSTFESHLFSMTGAPTDEGIDGPPSPLPHPCPGDQRDLPSPDASRRLPTELLASIFISIARHSYINENCNSTATGRPSWVNVSYVCRYWREVALNCPTLWSYIPTTSQRWTQELLARSQMTPLKVSTILSVFYRHQEQVVQVVEQVLNHSQRIQKLYLDVGWVSQATSYPILSRFLFTCLPYLQHLEISDFIPQGISGSLFEENTPALRTLRLKYCSMRWYALGPSVLTTLHVSNARIFIHEDTMADFLAMLRLMPHLVQLSLDKSLPSARGFLSNGELDATPMISLSRLSYLSITMVSLSATIALLSCVDIPLRTKVHLEVLPSDTTLDNYVRLAALLGQRISQSDSPNFRSVTIGNPWQIALAFSTLERVEQCYSPDPESFFSIGSDDDTLLKVDFVDELPMFEPDSLVLSSIYSLIPFTKIQSVHFLGLGVSLEFWREMLGSLSDVRHIRFSRYCPIPCITSMLSESLPSHHLTGSCQDGHVNEGKMLVPALEELELYQTTLESVRSRKDPNGYIADVQALYDAIAARKETRCRLTIKE